MNRYWDAWLEQGYHQQVHRTLGTTPQAAWDRSQAEHGAPRRLPVADIQRIFLWHEQRKVDKTGVIQLAGNRYEVDVALIGQMVDCRYDPFALDQIHVSFHGRAYGDATPLVLRHHRHREVPTTDLNFAQLAADRQQADRRKQQTHMRYAQPTTSSLEDAPHDA